MIGTLTQLRVVNASNQDLAQVIGMNRLRAAYLELDPGIERYLVASAHDDDRGIWQTYRPLMGPTLTQPLASSAAFIVLVPIFLTNAPHQVGLTLPVALLKQIELMVFGALIVFFLIVEPNGLARLWQIAKEKLRLWPFPH